MTKHHLLAFASTILIFGCTAGSRETDAQIIKDQIGRYEFVAAAGDYPALIVDTATGCVEVLYAIQHENVVGKTIEKSQVGFGMQGADKSCQFVGLAETAPRNVK